MKYHLLTFGCQMNKNDSERIAGLLLDLGFEETAESKEADLIILNTCSVRHSSEDRIYGMMKNFNKMKKERPEIIIVVTGCMAGRDKDGKIKARMPGVDIFLPTEEMIKLPEYLRKFSISNFQFSNFLDIKPKYSSPAQAFVTIQTGCEEYCTYCVVPSARGKIKNRPLQDILDEIKKLADAGCAEIMLLGQIVNAWKSGETNFADLLKEINKISGIRRLNFMSAHPRYMADEVINAMAMPAHVNFLHLPVQSGSDKILQKMNRRYTAEEYLEVIKKVRAAKPNIALATDIIVGFPGETKKDFEDTVGLYKECDFDIAFLAKYSPRSGTPAFKALKDDVPHDEKERRWRVLQKLMEETVLRKNQKYLGQTLEVLIESCKDGKCSGNSRECKRVVFLGDESLIGQIVNVKINEAKEWELAGDIA
jgi:tRNA-2-methylthio-N6-dimethylallyladenosine synthase